MYFSIDHSSGIISSYRAEARSWEFIDEIGYIRLRCSLRWIVSRG